jgi:hypothetical protein
MCDLADSDFPRSNSDQKFPSEPIWFAPLKSVDFQSISLFGQITAELRPLHY